jgi:hypothetical protein
LTGLSLVGRRATGRRDGRRLERFAEMRQGITSRGRSHPGLLPLANLRFEVSRLLPAVSSESDVATTPRARKRKLLPHAGHEFHPRSPGDVVGSAIGRPILFWCAVDLFPRGIYRPPLVCTNPRFSLFKVATLLRGAGQSRGSSPSGRASRRSSRLLCVRGGHVVRTGSPAGGRAPLSPVWAASLPPTRPADRSPTPS